VPRRIAARLLTGPLAFLLAGLIDVLALAIAQLRSRWGARGHTGRLRFGGAGQAPRTAAGGGDDRGPSTAGVSTMRGRAGEQQAGRGED
jgi:hypothetical protein